MENQPRFDLNGALLRWQRELGSQPGIGAEDVRELQTHLKESITAFQQRGLSEEEAFAKAREKLGSATELGAEFAKAHLLRVWRDRVFWIALLGFVLALYSSAFGQSLIRLAHRLRDSLGMSSTVLAISILAGIRFLLLSALLGSGYAEVLHRRTSWLFSQRSRLAVLGILVALAVNLIAQRAVGGWFLYKLGFLGFAVLVMPPEVRAASALKSRGVEDWRSSVGVWRDRLFWVLLAEMAVGAWTTVTLAGVYCLPMAGQQAAALRIIVAILYCLIWLGPMGVVGLGLWTGRLSVISRAARSRWHAALIAGGLLLILVGTKFWVSTWNFSSARFSAADWKFEFLLDTLCSLCIGVVLVALMVWLVPWQRHRRLIGRAEPA